MLGVITGASGAIQYHSSSRSKPSIKRCINIRDLRYAILLCQVLIVSVVVLVGLAFFSLCFVYILRSGCQITIVPWGERATTFEGDTVIDLGLTEPVVALFVRTLVKAYDGKCSC